MIRRTRQTFQRMKQDRLFTRLLLLFIALSLADLLLTIIGLHLRGFKGNLVFDLLAAHNIVIGALLWIGLTLLMVANMVIAYTAPSPKSGRGARRWPSVPSWRSSWRATPGRCSTCTPRSAQSERYVGSSFACYTIISSMYALFAAGGTRRAKRWQMTVTAAKSATMGRFVRPARHRAQAGATRPPRIMDSRTGDSSEARSLRWRAPQRPGSLLAGSVCVGRDRRRPRRR